MYAKFIDKDTIKPLKLPLDNGIYTNDPAVLSEYGYKPVVVTEADTDKAVLTTYYTEDESNIYIQYEYATEAETPTEPVNLVMSNDELTQKIADLETENAELAGKVKEAQLAVTELYEMLIDLM